MSYRVLVVDDERPARAKLVRLLAAAPAFELAGEADSAAAALTMLERGGIDLVLLDIEMPGMDGFELLDALGPARTFAVVFCTAHDDRALAAFDAHAVDYLLKPYDRARLEVALDKARVQLQGHAQLDLAGVRATLPPRSPPRLVVRAVDGWIHPITDEILRLSADDKHVRVHTRDRVHRVREALMTLSARLDPSRFVRVHRTEVVNVDAVIKLEPLGHGDALLTLRDGSTAVVSRTYRAEFVRRFGGRSSGAASG